MARPKSQPAPTIEDTIARKIESITSEIEVLQDQLQHWQKIADDYQQNRNTIESILSVHQAPDLSEPKKSKAGRKPKEV